MKKVNNKGQDQRDIFPVMRFDMNHRLLGCNLTALPILSSWNCRKGSKLSPEIMRTFPELQDIWKNMNPSECRIIFSGLEIWFDVIPFPEAGYIGLYGYHIQSLVPETVPQKLRMAG